MNKIKTFSCTIMAAMGMIACQCNEIAEITFPPKSENKTEITYPTQFVHPGIMHTSADMSRIKLQVDSKQEPIYSAFLEFQKDNRSNARYILNGPYKEIYRGDDGGKRQAIQTYYEQDFNAAYQNAVMYVITGNEDHAKKSVEIINAYANNLTAIVAGDQTLLAGIMGVKFIYAAEMMRYTYPLGLDDAQFKKFCNMIRTVFVPVLDTFMKTPPYSNGNWGASVGMTTIAAGILLDDMEMYKKGVKFYTEGNDNGTICNYVDAKTGQCQESGRDQAHTQLGLACLSVSCELAWKQGTDLYSLHENALMKGFEYTAKFNLGYDEVPFKVWKDITGKYCNWQTISQEKRGSFRPVFQMPYNHYVNRKHLDMPFTKTVVERTAPEGYYYEHFGFGTLLFNEK